jgi:hypothetical protein
MMLKSIHIVSLASVLDEHLLCPPIFCLHVNSISGGSSHARDSVSMA